jgi:hypothetical protein
MIKEYFWIAIIGILFNATLILMDVVGFLPLNLISFSLMFLVIFLLSLYRPVWMFWIFIISLPLESVIISSNQIPISFRPFQVIALMLFLATVFLLLFKVKNKKISKLIEFNKDKIFKKGNHFNYKDFLVLILVLLSSISLNKALNFDVTLKLNLVLVSFVMIYFLARFYLQEKQRKLEALWFFIATSLPVLFFGIYQAVAYKMNWFDFQVFAERSNGTFVEPDWFGIYLVFLGALIYWVKLYLFRTNNSTMIGVFEIKRAGQWFLNFQLALISVVLLLTVARSAWLGFAFLTVIYFFCLLRQKQILNLNKFLSISFLKEALTIFWIGLFAILIVSITGLSNFNLTNRATSSFSGLEKITISCQGTTQISVPEKISNIDELNKYNCQHIRLEEIELEKKAGMKVKTVYRPDPNIEIRKDIYQITWREIQNNFWIGQGLGSSAEVLGKDSYGHGFNASNIFLEIWFSFGVIGLAVFVWLFLGTIIEAFKNILNKSKSEIGKNLIIILVGVALLIPNLFNAGIFLVIFWVWLAVANS